MLTYNKDIYKRIMEPLGIKYFICEDGDYYTVPSNRQKVWQFLFPKQIRDRVALNESSFSAINMGKSDKKNCTDSARNSLKQVLLYSNSEYYKYMSNHLNNIMEDNIIVEMWLANHKRTINQVSLKRDIVAEYLEKQPDKVEKNISNTFRKLSLQLIIHKEEIVSDVRFSEDFWKKVYDIVEIDFMQLLEILCLASIFSADDNDYGFFETFENHYLKIIKNKSNMISRVSYSEIINEKKDISNVFDILENEKNRLDIRFLERNKRKKMATKTIEATEKCEKYMLQLRCLVKQMENKEKKDQKIEDE